MRDQVFVYSLFNEQNEIQMRKPDQTEKGIHPLFYQYVTKTRFRQVIALGFLLDHFEFEVKPTTL